MRIIFYPVSLIFALGVWVREKLYDLGLKKSYGSHVQILSVGNLTFGGTGKTPVVDFLIRDLKKKKKIAVLSRGYGRNTKGFLEVSANENLRAEKYGDEPTLIKSKHPEVRVFVGEDRVHACREIERLGAFDLIIADDCFQHRRLKRDIDVIVIDATEKLLNYNYPPVGRARNSFHYLKRADFVFLTKTNLASSDQLSKIKNKLEGKPVVEFQSVIEGFYDLKSGEQVITPPKEASLISGIGNPESFENLTLQAIPGLSIRAHLSYRDHHRYSAADMKNIKKKVGQGAILLTTEKDAVKLREISKDLRICVAKLVFESKSSLERFYEVLH